MGMNIFLRTNKQTSYFQRNLLKIIEAPGVDELILCSGYVSYGKNYKTLDENLRAAIISQKVKVTTVGGMFAYKYGASVKQKYDEFVDDLKQHSVPVIKRIAKNKKWHAKVAITFKKRKPVAGIVGSSNLTRPAYSETGSGFNHEADVLIWIDQKAYNNHFRDIELEELQKPLGPMFVVFDKEINKIPEEGRLKALYNEVLENTEEE